MKLGFSISSILLVILLLFAALTPATAQNKTLDYVSRIIQSFDPAEESESRYRTWALLPSKFGYDLEGNSLWDKQFADTWPQQLFGRNKENIDHKVLGLHGSFLRRGYNYVEIVPGEGEGDSFVPKPIEIPGKAARLDIWVWGSNHNYYLEAYVRDQDGIDHVLPLGSIQHVGWKNHYVNFPNSIIQSWNYIPAYRPLVFTKLVLWTRPQEKVDDFYMYLDQIKVLTDVFVSRFDGDQLTESDKLQEIWGASTE